MGNIQDLKNKINPSYLQYELVVWPSDSAGMVVPSDLKIGREPHQSSNVIHTYDFIHLDRRYQKFIRKLACEELFSL